MISLWVPLAPGELADPAVYDGWLTAVVPRRLLPREEATLSLEVRTLLGPSIRITRLRELRASWPSP